MNDLLAMASGEYLAPSSGDKEKTMLLCIDVQQDFMDGGALGVPGANDDTRRLTRFIYDNLEKITNIAVSLDTHSPFQIFHPCWWVDGNGDNPPPFTAITLFDIDAGKWRAVTEPQKSREYVANLEKSGRKVLIVWTYHCLQGTNGHALESNFANMIYFHSVARKSAVTMSVKGQEPLSEMYGIIKPEYSAGGYVNNDVLGLIDRFDKVIIAGEAKSHCVLESVRQILDNFEDTRDVAGKIILLVDCMSSIPGFEKTTEEEFERFRRQYKADLIKSTELRL